MKRQGLQGVPRQDRGGLVEGLVAGGPAAPQVVVVHGRQVVVDQRIGVDQLHRHRRGVQPPGFHPQGAPRGIYQHRPYPLAAIASTA
jgi:hypothetical protein